MPKLRAGRVAQFIAAFGWVSIAFFFKFHCSRRCLIIFAIGDRKVLERSLTIGGISLAIDADGLGQDGLSRVHIVRSSPFARSQQVHGNLFCSKPFVTSW